VVGIIVLRLFTAGTRRYRTITVIIWSAEIVLTVPGLERALRLF
jgi:hypothetical protein